MSWQMYRKGFAAFLQLERSHQPNTIESYLHDYDLLAEYCKEHFPTLSPVQVELNQLSEFIRSLSAKPTSSRSIGRIISGIRAFFSYLIMEDVISENPAELLDRPKPPRNLPIYLTIDEIDKMVASIDLSYPLGFRNKTIIETLYGAGLRVSELTTLTISNINFKENFLKITGKGSKQRLVPLGEITARYISQYLEIHRMETPPSKGHEDFVFLNNKGRQLTREMIFTIVKNIGQAAGIRKKISPHIFRHSFATHLVQAGADLRVVQELLGHESITTTEIYTHLDRAYLQEAIVSFHPRSKTKKY
ncbi:MAG TPA: tyrosine recombinase XerD [Bacteroidales bacterium]|nr:tyrosine recombinase XerD [Bacteroidales bacterium]